MKWARIAVGWKQLKGRVMSEWGELTDEDFDGIAGRRPELTDTIQTRYGLAEGEAAGQVSSWMRRVTLSWFKAEPSGRSGDAGAPRHHDSL